MITIDESYVETAAPNLEAMKNGRALVAKGKFLSLRIDAEQTVIFGECQGSGKEPYRCSSDFARADQPTHRCTCPSRQFPCKHCIGLMFAYVLKRAAFTTGEMPADLAEKREKLLAKSEKKRDEVPKPKTINKSALSKKIQAQLDGLDLLERLTLDLARLGIGNMNAKAAREIEDKAKLLGDSYLPGAQAALHRYTTLFSDETGRFASNTGSMEAIFSEAMDQLSRLHVLVKQGRLYLSNRLSDPDLKPETESGIAAWLGHAWQLGELKAAGLFEANVDLIQLAFNSYDDVARKEFVDTGIWMNLTTGRVQLTQNFRPYKAAKFIKSDDSVFHVVQVKELYIYPGEVNPRIRWDAMEPRAATSADYARVKANSQREFVSVIKEVKSNLKLPLADKRPVYALAFGRIGEVDGKLVMEDAKGERLVLSDDGVTDEPATCDLLRLLPSSDLIGQTLVGRFRHDLEKRTLQVKPLSIVTDRAIVRLTY